MKKETTHGNGIGTLLDHGAIGNGRVIALVSPTSAIEWLCLPRFDSPSIFARLLDREKGGCLRVLSSAGETSGSMRYLKNTNVLSTTFEAGATAWEILDFAPRIPEGLGVRSPVEIVRILHPLKGKPRLSIDFDPRPDYGRVTANMYENGSGIEVLGCAAPVHLASDIPAQYILGKREFVLDRPMFLCLHYGRLGEIPTLSSMQSDLDMTVAGWRAWAKTCSLPTYAAEKVLRSALCLKLHTYEDTGAIIAAATTSIPEALGTPRTWDYRYCWLRDAAFVVEALRRLSHLQEGERFVSFLRNAVEARPLHPVYGIGGEHVLEEGMLPHLSGVAGNGHVRIGNAAYLQRQNDLMGEVVLCLDTLLRDPRVVIEDRDGIFSIITRLVRMAIESAPQEDTGIWEFRSMLRPYTFSRAMCWVAAQRGADLARTFGRHYLAQRWQAFADSEREVVLGLGYSHKLGFFTQALNGEFPDASNLLLPTIGIVDAKDPRFVSTVEAYERLLVEKGLMLRYRNEDDFGATTSALTVCSFWWAEALALMGRLEAAVTLFDRLAANANHLGLFSEDIDPDTGMLLGNFPQAYTHVGLVHAAMTIGEISEVTTGKVRAWK
jgi:GH15 family glucan-1,4-alpha-glucosidase